MNLLLERGTNILPGLTDIDRLFGQLKQDPDDAAIKNKLESELQNIFGVQFIIEIVKSGELSDNFAVLPIMKVSSKSNNQITETTVKLFDFDLVYLFIGVDLLKISKPKQITAILLHEIGHVIEHSSTIQTFLMSMLHKINYASNLLSRIPIINFVFFPLLIITSRTLTFTNHAYEYGADKFAVKYGYGDEIAQWCLDHLKHNSKNKTTNNTSLFKFIESIFDYSTHPTFNNRLIEVTNEIKQTYSKHYNNKKIDAILNKYYKLNS